jgi:hypothetical protein
MTAAVKRARAKAPAEPSPDEVAVERILWRVRLRLQRRLRWLQSLDDRATAALSGGDHPAAEAAWRAHDVAGGELEAELAAIERDIFEDRLSRVAQLCGVFGLEPRETDVLHATLATALDPSLRQVVAAVSDRRDGAITESLVARLFDHGRRGPPGDGPLRNWRLVHRDETMDAAMEIDAVVRAWVTGRTELDASLVGAARRAPVYEPLASWPVDRVVTDVRAALDRDPACRIRVQVIGVPGSGRRSFAAAVAARLGFAALMVDADEMESADWPRAFHRAQRQAFLAGLALIWSGEQLRRRWPTTPDMFALQFAVIESSADLSPHARLVDYQVELPLPSWMERRALWRGYVHGAARWPASSLDRLARAHRIGPGEIASAAKRNPATAIEAGRAVRRGARHRIGDLAQVLPTTFRWDDLVISDELRATLDDIVFEAANRGALWERPAARRLFPQGRGLIVLFSGPPGTGKTMAAQVVARRLRLDLFRIDLSTIVSKYVGETSQNLERVLKRASRTDAVLFFDEADALFGKRTEVRDAHDRFANTDTGYLLQAIESYQGVAMLATNKKANIDPAFTRRLRYVIDFPKPTAAQRHLLWQRLVGELVGADRGAALDESLRVIADSVDATGAQIKSAVLGAIFSAGREQSPVGFAHLLRGIDRELAKEGRVVSDRERRRLLERVG